MNLSGQPVGVTGGLRAYIAKGATGSFALSVSGAMLALLTSLVLARVLGAKEYGGYVNAMAWVQLIAVAATFGFPLLLVREVAIYRTNRTWGLFLGLLRFSYVFVFLASLILMALAALAGWALFGSKQGSIMLYPLWAGLLILPFISLSALNQGIISGFGRVVLGQFPSAVIVPSLFISCIVFTYVFCPWDITASVAVFTRLISMIAAFGIGLYLVFRAVIREGVIAYPEYETGRWFRSAAPLAIIAAMSIVVSRVGIIMLGAIIGAEAAGIFKVATRGAELIMFSLAAVNQPFRPLIAGLWARGDKERLQRIVTKGTRSAFIIALPVALLLIIWGDKFLLLFGEDFAKGRFALAVLAFGYLFNVGCGMVGVLLNMSGYERDTALGLGIGAVFNIVLTVLLVPRWGINGAAVACTSGMVFWNIFLVTRVATKMHISSSIFGKIG
jgi:O-antigen/teichoic acid export membrane protein